MLYFTCALQLPLQLLKTIVFWLPFIIEDKGLHVMKLSDIFIILLLHLSVNILSSQAVYVTTTVKYECNSGRASVCSPDRWWFESHL